MAPVCCCLAVCLPLTDPQRRSGEEGQQVTNPKVYPSIQLPFSADNREPGEVGMIVDAGSGKTAALWYRLQADTNGSLTHVEQLRRKHLQTPENKGNTTLHGMLSVAEEQERKNQIRQFVRLICREIKAARTCADPLPMPKSILVGATGGMRKAVESGELKKEHLPSSAEFSEHLQKTEDFDEIGLNEHLDAFNFIMLTGEQEGQLELQAARAIWGKDFFTMFPGEGDAAGVDAAEASLQLGLFSAGGQSMQVSQRNGEPLSLSLSIYWDALEERSEDRSDWDDWRPQGPEAQEPAAWRAWEEGLVASVNKEREGLVKRGIISRSSDNAQGGYALLDGCYVLTLMNAVAAHAAGIIAVPIRASEVIQKCRDAIGRFKRKEGDAYAAFLKERSYVKWNLARVATMHMCRLAHVLERLFAPTARLYAPKVPKESVMCEWTLGAFIEPPPAEGGRIGRYSV